MAKRKQLFHPDEVREKIKTSQLCNRLNQHAFGEIELTPTQVRAIEILLKKTIPDLSSIDATLSGEVTSYVLSSEPMTENDWEATYGVAASEGATKSTH